MPLAENVARNILATREAKKLTQTALATKAKISVSYVSMLERGQRVPPLYRLESIAKALGVPPLDLLEPARKVARRTQR